MATTTLKRFDEVLFAELQDTEFALAYLQDSLDESIEEFLVALRKYVQANGGVQSLASRSGLKREALYRMLSVDGNPEFRSIEAILNAIGIKIKLQSGPLVPA